MNDSVFMLYHIFLSLEHFEIISSRQIKFLLLRYNTNNRLLKKKKKAANNPLLRVLSLIPVQYRKKKYGLQRGYFFKRICIE